MAPEPPSYGADAGYYDRAADELIIIVQIETPQAVENVAEIAAVDGVDVVFVGPRDMSAALGKLNKMDDPELRALIAKVEQATLASGKALGTVAPTAALVKELFGRGYTFLIAGSDLSHLRAGITQMMKDAGHVSKPARRRPYLRHSRPTSSWSAWSRPSTSSAWQHTRSAPSETRGWSDQVRP